MITQYEKVLYSLALGESVIHLLANDLISIRQKKHAEKIDFTPIASSLEHFYKTIIADAEVMNATIKLGAEEAFELNKELGRIHDVHNGYKQQLIGLEPKGGDGDA